MFLKLTLYNEDPNFKVPIMVNMDNVIGYTDYYNAEYERDPISQVRTFKKERICTYIYIDISEKSYRGKGIQVCESMEEINHKMAQLERRNNDNSNRKR